MIKNYLLVFILLAIAVQVQCQAFIIHGKIIDKETGNPVAGASVFLSNTSIGTAADEKGVFVLHNIPSGKFDLVISSLGYETYFETINTATLQQPIVVSLKSKANELASVVIGTYDKNGWANWGKVFLQDFIGTSPSAENCEIKNYSIIKFHYSKTKQYLQAFADEPLIVENRALGYIIRYKLEGFEHDFGKNTISYYGFPLFQEMQGNVRKQKRWKDNRKEVYFGSVLHFMRCLYVNKLQESGYEIKRLEKIENVEKKRVQALYKYLAGADGNTDFEDKLPPDSLAYYSKILKQPDARSILHNELLPGDSIAYGADSVTAAVFFKDHLQITYKHKKEPVEYSQRRAEHDSPSGFITSVTSLVNGRPLYVSYNGSYYAPQDMLSEGYWAYSEKLSELLPFDYWP